MAPVLLVLMVVAAGACASEPKKFSEGQCYQPLYWPSDCERVPRPPLRAKRGLDD